MESHVASRVAVVVFLFHWVIHSKTGSDKYTLKTETGFNIKKRNWYRT